MKKSLLSFLTVVLVGLTGFAQTTVCTIPTLPGNNGSGGIAFQVNPAAPVLIQSFDVAMYSGSQTVNIWYTSVDTTGNPNVTAPNWTQILTNASATGIGGINNPQTTNVPITPLLLNPGTYRFYISCSANLVYTTWNTSYPATFTAGMVTVGVGTGVGYGGNAPNPPFHPRAFTGCVNYVPASGLDLATSQLTNPTVLGVGTDTIRALFANFAADTITQADLSYSFNGGTPVVVNDFVFPSPLGPGDDYEYQFNSQISVASSGFYDVSVWVSDVNGLSAPDSNINNDTLNTTLCTGLEGTFTIDSTGSGDYETFADAVADMIQCGIADTVIFEVVAGSYTELVSIPSVVGASETSPITFKAQNGLASSVVLRGAPTSTFEGVLQLNGAKWVNFENITITNIASSSSYGNVVILSGDASNNKIEGCVLNGQDQNTTSTLSAVVYANSQGLNNNSFMNNEINEGSYSFYYYGNFSTHNNVLNFVGNHMDGFYYTGMWIYYTDSITLDENDVNYNSFYTFGYGLRMWDCDKNISMSKNRIGTDPSATGFLYYPWYVYNCDGVLSQPTMIANNCISAGYDGSSSFGYGGYFNNSGALNLYNNSFNNLSGGSGYGFYMNGGGLIKMKNNSFATYGSGYAFYNGSTYAVSESDNNNFYTGGSNPIYWSAVYNSLEAYQTATGNDMNSVSTDPAYSDTSNCFTCNDTLDGGGQSLAMIMDDRVGQVRSQSTPDIGSSEFIAAGSFTLGPDTTLCGTEYTIEAGPAQSVLWTVVTSSGTTTSTDPSFTLVAGDEPVQFSVSVNIVTQNCGPASDAVTLTLIPDAQLDDSVHICADESVTLEPGGGGTATYMWSNMEMTPTITVSEGGMYSVTKNEMGCESMASIMVTQSDSVDILDVEPCEADIPITLDATIADGVSYAWSAGATPNAAQNEFSASGSYTVTATDAFGCVSDDMFTITVLEKPVAVIDYSTFAGTLVQFSSANSSFLSANTTYFWNFGHNNDTSSMPNPSYQYPWSNPSSPSVYNVVLSIDNGCEEGNTTQEIVIDPTGIVSVNNGEGLTVYPNPANERITIALEDNAINSVDLRILSTTGALVMTESLIVNQGQTQVNLSDLPAGVYTLELVSETSTYNTRLIVE